MPEVMVTAT